MKNTVLFLSILFMAHIAGAQVDRSKRPEPAPAKEIAIGKYQKFTLKNGLRVIVVENRKFPQVAFSLIIDRDPILEEDKVGYTSMAGAILRNGTTTRTKAQLDEEVDFIGASLTTSSTSVFGSSLTKHRDKLLDLFTDVLYNPAFLQEELDEIKKQTLSVLKSIQDNPDAISGNIKSKVLYGDNHPYGQVQKETDVEAITMEDLKNYYDMYFRPNFAYLAIVGDISLKEARKIVTKRFGKWEPKEVQKKTYPLPEQPDRNVVVLANRSNSVQTVLNISYPILLRPGSPESIKARVMNQILGVGGSGRLFKNIREDKRYTYGAYSSVSSNKWVGNFNAGASVRNEVTDSAVYEFLSEMKRIVEEEVSEEELQLAKNVIIGNFGRSLETPGTVANFAINTERYNLPEDYYNNYVKNIQAVSSSDVRAIAKELVKPENSYIIAVGKADEIKDGLQKFGKVMYVDIYGNETDPSLSKIPKGLTPQDVIRKYIRAIGGEARLSELKSLTMEMEASAMNQKMEMVLTKMAPDRSMLEVKMGGNVVRKQVFDGERGKMSGMGGEQVIEGKKARDMKVSSAMVEEMMILQEDFPIRLASIESINGKDAYALEVTAPSGKVSTRYYDTATGYLLSVAAPVEMPQGNIVLATDFDEYRSFDGIFFPTSIAQPMGPQMKMEVQVKKIDINPEIDPSIFNIE